MQSCGEAFCGPCGSLICPRQIDFDASPRRLNGDFQGPSTTLGAATLFGSFFLPPQPTGRVHGTGPFFGLGVSSHTAILRPQVVASGLVLVDGVVSTWAVAGLDSVVGAGGARPAAIAASTLPAAAICNRARSLSTRAP